ncbi:MAG: hypothetical protein N4A41_04365 [Crocinitomicaceae bacterium]|jgi:hypothetical protein|nr:hypothetical protein [Crocinitomicaceae bacterium]
MHKYILVALLLGGMNAHACDVCGCAVGPISLGNVSTHGFHFIGLQTNYLQTSSIHPASIFSHSYQSSQRFFSASLQGKYQWTNRWSLLGNIPFWHKESSENGSLTAVNGLGDLSAQVQLVLYQKSDSVKQLVVRAATGIKAPTGTWKDRNTSVQNLYPGSGSWDYPSSLQAIYNGRSKLLQFEVNYLYRNYNSNGFRFGDSFSNSLGWNHILNTSKMRFFFGANVQYTLLMTDRQRNSAELVTNNHGDYLTLEPSVMVLLNKTMFKIQSGLPIYQNLGEGNVHLYPSIQIQYIQLIQKKSK